MNKPKKKKLHRLMAHSDVYKEILVHNKTCDDWEKFLPTTEGIEEINDYGLCQTALEDKGIKIILDTLNKLIRLLKTKELV